MGRAPDNGTLAEKMDQRWGKSEGKNPNIKPGPILKEEVKRELITQKCKIQDLTSFPCISFYRKRNSFGSFSLSCDENSF